jgi:hypothetical protein
MKNVYVAIGLMCLTSLVWAGNEGGGGGDGLEIRVDEIRSDILDWIGKGGAKGLNLKSPLSLEVYESKMKEILEPKKVVVGFVERDDETDDELKVSVDGAPKTCRGFYSRIDARPHILCNISRFENTSESVQYKLIHHEYAGLVGLEKNEGAASDYEISSQISKFLTMQLILKLAVEPAESKFSISRMIKDDLYATCKNAGQGTYGMRYDCVIEDGKNNVISHHTFARSKAGQGNMAFFGWSGQARTELGRQGMSLLMDYLGNNVNRPVLTGLKDGCFVHLKINDATKNVNFPSSLFEPQRVKYVKTVCE